MWNVFPSLQKIAPSVIRRNKNPKSESGEFSPDPSFLLYSLPNAHQYQPFNLVPFSVNAR